MPACQHWPWHMHTSIRSRPTSASRTARSTKAIPDVMAGYGALHDAAFVEGALDVKTKELIALSIAITRECDGCIAAHGRNLARLGATTEEVAEMIGVAITMNGGPGLGVGRRGALGRPSWSTQSEPASGVRRGGSARARSAGRRPA